MKLETSVGCLAIAIVLTIILGTFYLILGATL